MLILTRKPRESIIIGDDIKITVTEVNGRQVRLAIHAPRHIRVDREEIRAQRKMRHPSDADAPPIYIADYDFDPRN